MVKCPDKGRGCFTPSEQGKAQQRSTIKLEPTQAVGFQELVQPGMLVGAFDSMAILYRERHCHFSQDLLLGLLHAFPNKLSAKGIVPIDEPLPCIAQSRDVDAFRKMDD